MLSHQLEESPEENILSALDEVWSKYVLEVFTPWSVFKMSLSNSFLYTDASPTSLFFSAGPCLSVANVVKSTQSSMSSSYWNHDGFQSNNGGIFVVIP